MKMQRGDVYEGEWKQDQMHGHGTLRHYEGSVYQGIWENGNRVDQQGVYSSPHGQQLQTTDYRLKEKYRKPMEYLNSQDRHKAIEVDASYFRRLQEVEHDQNTSHAALQRTDLAGVELAPYL